MQANFLSDTSSLILSFSRLKFIAVIISAKLILVIKKMLLQYFTAYIALNFLFLIGCLKSDTSLDEQPEE